MILCDHSFDCYEKINYCLVNNNNFDMDIKMKENNCIISNKVKVVLGCYSRVLI